MVMTILMSQLLGLLYPILLLLIKNPSTPIIMQHLDRIQVSQLGCSAEGLDELVVEGFAGGHERPQDDLLESLQILGLHSLEEVGWSLLGGRKGNRHEATLWLLDAVPTAHS